jgi:hypothetical protein
MPLRPNTAAVALNDSLHSGQTDAKSTERLGTWETLEWSKQFVR